MLSLSEQEMIFKLLDGGKKPTEIARQLNRSIGSILKYKKLQKLPDELTQETTVPTDPLPEKIVPFQEHIRQYLKLKKRNIFRLFQELQAIGYGGSYSLLNSYVRIRLIPREKRYKRSAHVETGPGEQAQVDWGSFGMMRVGDRMEKLYAFVYVLSYSRAVYVEFVVRQNQQTLQNCHINAFNELGIPRTIRYDNMKTVIIRREKMSDGSKKLHLNSAFKDFALYYGFETVLCPPYWPRAKGKVEIGVKYLKGNFAQGKAFKKTLKSLEELNERTKRWLQSTANSRIHRTTEVKPEDRWLEEKPFLRFPNGLPVYNAMPLLRRWSSKDGMVQYRSNIYSVPTPYCQKSLSIREVADHGLPQLEIYYQNKLIAKHKIFPGRGKWVVDDVHMAASQNQTRVISIKKKGGKKKKTEIPDMRVSVRELDYYNFL